MVDTREDNTNPTQIQDLTNQTTADLHIMDTEMEEATVEDIELLMEDIMARQDTELLTEIIRQGMVMEEEEGVGFINVNNMDIISSQTN